MAELDRFSDVPETQVPNVRDLPSIEVDNMQESDFLTGDVGDFDMGKAAPREEGQALDEVSESFGALRDSISQSRELKAREKELEVLADRLHADREELRDRDDILANYAGMAAEQQAIIDENVRVRGDRKSQLSSIMSQTDETQAALDRMRQYHASQLQPIETQLGSARAAADQAKNDERSRKSELSAAESELRKADDASIEIATAQQRHAQSAYNEAKTRSESMKAQLKEAEKAYEVTRKKFEGEQAPLAKSIEELNAQADALQNEIADLEAAIDAAVERKQYIEEVYHNPAETEQLRADVAAYEEDQRKMGEENEQLRVRLEQSKDKAKKAKIVVGAAIAIVVIIVLILIFVL